MRTVTKTVPNIYIWRRLHGGELIAEVTLNPGIGVWRVSAYRVHGRASELAYTGKAYSMLTDARRGADELVCREFGHECHEGECGRWLRWALSNHDDPA